MTGSLRITGMARRLNQTRPYLVDTLIAFGVLVAMSVQFIVPRIPDAPPTSWWSYGLTAAAVLPLIWRRRFPFAVLLATNLPMWINKWLDGVGQPMPYTGLIAVYTVALLSTVRVRVAMHVLALTVIPIVVLANTGEAREYLFTFFVYFSAYTMGRLALARQQQTQALLARTKDLERVNRAEAEQAASAERARIARDMHDILSHSVSLMIVQAEAGPVAVRGNPERAERAFDSIADTGRQAMTQLRRMLGVLKDNNDGDGSRPQPTLDEIPELLERVSETGAPVDLEIRGEPVELPLDAQLAVYRIIQEALTNMVKHADARRAAVVLDWSDDRLTVTVGDDGKGRRSRPRPDSGGHGLINMRQRAAAHGGSVAAGPRPDGRGFQVVARFPLDCDDKVVAG